MKQLILTVLVVIGVYFVCRYGHNPVPNNYKYVVVPVSFIYSKEKVKEYHWQYIKDSDYEHPIRPVSYYILKTNGDTILIIDCGDFHNREFILPNKK